MVQKAIRPTIGLAEVGLVMALVKVAVVAEVVSGAIVAALENIEPVHRHLPGGNPGGRLPWTGCM